MGLVFIYVAIVKIYNIILLPFIIYIYIRVGQKLGVMHQPQKFIIPEFQIDAST